MKTAGFFGSRKVRRVLAALACIALVYGGFRLYQWAWPRIHYASLDRQEWREDMEPWEYFPPVPPDAKELTINYSKAKYYSAFFGESFSRQLEELVAEGAVPDMGGEYSFWCQTYYDNGSVHTVRFIWEHEEFGRLVVNASPVSGESAANGGCFLGTYGFEGARNALITRREDVDIICAGAEWEEKCMRFYRDGAWYQVYGESGIDYKEMVKVMGFFFEHPIDFDRFGKDCVKYY